MTKPMVWTFAAIPSGKAAKYKYPLISPFRYTESIVYRQTSQEVFALSGLTKAQTKYASYLLKQLKYYAPVKTGNLRASYDVYPLQTSKWEWALVIYNKAWYFRFPFHFYYDRGVDFVREAVDDTMKRILGAK